MDFESLNLVGSPFEHVETYVYYDGPRTFALRSLVVPDLYYIINTVDEDDTTGELTMLAVAVNRDGFNAVRSGLVPFRDAFSLARAGALFSVRWEYDDNDAPRPQIAQLAASEIPSDWLPASTIRLDLPTQTVEPYRSNDLVSLATAQHRSIFALEVQTPESRITEFPARSAGELQIAIHGEIIALANEYVSGSKTSAHKEIRLNVLELRAASFVIIMGIDTPGALFEPIEVTEVVFERLRALVDAVGTGDPVQFLATMKQHNATVRNRFKDILKPLSTVRSGLTLSTVAATQTSISGATATPDQVWAAYNALETVEPEVNYIDVPRGVLMGLVLRTKRYEIFDAAAGVTYKGYMTDEAASSANGLTVGDTSYVRARIRIETPFTNEEDETTGIKHILENVEVRKEEESDEVRQDG